MGRRVRYICNLPSCERFSMPARNGLRPIAGLLAFTAMRRSAKYWACAGWTGS